MKKYKIGFFIVVLVALFYLNVSVNHDIIFSQEATAQSGPGDNFACSEFSEEASCNSNVANCDGGVYDRTHACSINCPPYSNIAKGLYCDGNTDPPQPD
ncbi:MAG: hypothetical protein FH748_03300 [Balneolaceae bacterium]|nr:hypothetical protein [Balneolaceae bacterium]